MSVIAKRIALIGTGLIGASLAKAAKAAGSVEAVVGVGRNPANLAVALETGCVDEVSQDPLAAVASADLIVIATPVDTAVELLPGLAASARPDAWFTDVGSVKQPIVAAADAARIGERFVGGHPIAGGTLTSASAANVDLFRDRTVILTPTAATAPQVLVKACALWESTGARVVETTAGIHDRMLAYTSHLPQFVVFALCAAVARGGELPAHAFGSGFRDTTRLAGSDQEMWLAVSELNRQAIVEAMDGFGAVWSELRAAVDRGDTGAVRALLDEARVGKERAGR